MKKEENIESILEDYRAYCEACEILERDYSEGKVSLEDYAKLSNAFNDYQNGKFGHYMHHFDSVEEFGKAYLAYFDKEGKGFAEKQIEHELQHGAVAEKYNFDVTYGFFLFEGKDFFVARPFCYVAFPEDMSEDLLGKFRKEVAEAVDDPSSRDLAFSDTE